MHPSPLDVEKPSSTEDTTLRAKSDPPGSAHDASNGSANESASASASSLSAAGLGAPLQAPASSLRKRSPTTSSSSFKPRSWSDGGSRRAPADTPNVDISPFYTRHYERKVSDEQREPSSYHTWNEKRESLRDSKRSALSLASRKSLPARLSSKSQPPIVVDVKASQNLPEEHISVQSSASREDVEVSIFAPDFVTATPPVAQDSPSDDCSSVTSTFSRDEDDSSLSPPPTSSKRSTSLALPPRSHTSQPPYPTVFGGVQPQAQPTASKASISSGDSAEDTFGEVHTPPTFLHMICSNAKNMGEVMHANDHVTVTAAAATDALGRTPLHLISLNKNLSSLAIHDMASAQSTSGQSVIDTTGSNAQAEQELTDFIVTILWKAYRPAMITPDKDGNIPFQGALDEWVQGSYRQHLPKPKQGSARSGFWTLRKSRSTRWLRKQHSARDLLTDANTATDVETGTIATSPNKTRPSNYPHVCLSAHALFCFRILSAMVQRMDDRRLESSKKATSGTTPLRPRLESDHEQEIHSAVKELRNMTVEDIGAEIVQSIASIPNLVKTVLLIADETQRKTVLSTLIMRRVLASKYSVGNWLTKMLQHASKRVSDRAIEYLTIVSDPTLFEARSTGVGGSWRRSEAPPSARTINSRQMEQDELYYEVSRLQDFVPSLLSLCEKDVEEAATLRLVKRVLDQRIARPFAATVVVCDALFLAVVIIGLRVAVNNLLLGSPPGTVVNYLYAANTGLFYFIIRELGKAVSLLMMTRRARVYFWSFWNLSDMLSTILAFASVVSIRAFVSSSYGPMPTYLRNLVAVTTGLLWIRVLSYLKGLNQQLATFVLAIIQITRDVIWFCVILFTLIISFAQMFFTLLAPASCMDGIDPAEKECIASEYYLGTYAILLGDFGTFGRARFTTLFSVILAVAFTFIVVLVLLNVLIAVASDSYEKCLVRSQNLFGRARVMLIAELVSFQNLLRRNLDASRGPTRVYNAWWSSGSLANGWSRGSVMFFTLSLLLVTVWIIWETSGLFSGTSYGNIWLGIGSMFINFGLFVAIMFFLSMGASDVGSRPPTSKNSTGSARDFSEWYKYFIHKFVGCLLVSSSDKPTGTTGAELEGWQGRLVFLQQEMARVSHEGNAEAMRKMEALESSLSSTETKLKNELLAVEQGLKDVQLALAASATVQPGNPQLHETLSELLRVVRNLEQQNRSF